MFVHYYGAEVDPPWDNDYHPLGGNFGHGSGVFEWLVILAVIGGLVLLSCFIHPPE